MAVIIIIANLNGFTTAVLVSKQSPEAKYGSVVPSVRNLTSKQFQTTETLVSDI